MTISPKLQNYLKKIGIWGFLFFLIKGLIWVVIAYLIVK